jgi:hypothetical protein
VSTDDPERDPTVTFSDLTSGEYALVIEGHGTAEGEYDVFMNCSSIPTVCSHERCKQPNHPDAEPEHRCFKLVLECDYDLDSLLPCDAEELELGDRCERDGECGTLSNANNCPGGFDVYNFTHRPIQTVVAPAQTTGQPSTPTITTSSTPISTPPPSPPKQHTRRIQCGGTIHGSTANIKVISGGKTNELWYMFTAKENGTYTIDACESSFDTELRIQQFPTRKELFTCDDCGGCSAGTRSRMAVQLTAGSYIFGVGGHTQEDKGHFAFTLVCLVPLVGDAAIRLDCTKTSGSNTRACHHGRVEVFDPTGVNNFGPERPHGRTGGRWGTVCGHDYGENDNTAVVICRHLGFAHGEAYTFGAARSLLELPIVAAHRICNGNESSVFDCLAYDEDDEQCSHQLDLHGVVCYDAEDQSQIQKSRDKCSPSTHHISNPNQPVIFGCIDFYSAHCRFNASEAPSFALSLEQFAVCSEMLQPPGYCHGSLRTAAQLRNEEVCECGASFDLGFHIRIPFYVQTPGQCTFRVHAKFGRGSFMGINGVQASRETDGNHIRFGPQHFDKGDHEVEVLGFEDCCDSHVELEVHLPCDGPLDEDAIWRIVQSGCQLMHGLW